MKLSFSPKSFKKLGVTESLVKAIEYKYDGIELPASLIPGEGSLTKLYHSLKADKKDISCICVEADAAADAPRAISELEKAIKAAVKLHCPYISIYLSEEYGAFLGQALEMCEKNSVVLLVETKGVYSDTSKLRATLESYASDNLACVWCVHEPLRVSKESPETTITNLGAFVKHMRINDSDEGGRYCLMGEGSIPTGDIVSALRSINYDGFVSLAFSGELPKELCQADIVLPHYSSVMSVYDAASLAKQPLYQNKTGTGQFIWKKDVLIEKTFGQVLDSLVNEFPNQYAFKYTTLDYTRTYSEFRDDVDDFAKALIAMGVRKGSHVALWATNVPAWYIAFWATTKIGAVLVSMNTAYKIHEAEYLLRQSDTHTVILTEGFKDSNYAQIMHELCPEIDSKPDEAPLHAKRLPFLRNIVTVGFEMKGCLEWNKALTLGKKISDDEVRFMANNVDIHNVCNMQYTSGTTGFPKGVMLTHYNVVNNGKCIGDRMDLSTADRMMIQVPMFHCFGMVLAMTAAMTHSSTMCPIPYFSPKSSLACVNQEKITAFHGVPTMFIAMLEHEDFDKTDFSHMRTGIMAGSPCPEAIMNQVIEKMNMREITIVFGQTESSPGCTMSSTDDPVDVRVATVGRPLPEIECKIVDPETGLDLPDDTPGEFVARGYNIMKGYYKMPKATASAIDKEGWLHTGDIAVRTPEGNYRITGRLKDMIIRGGENIYPKEIEEIIYTHPSVRDVQVIGIPDEQYGEEIMACVIVKEGESLDEKQLREYMLSRAAKHKCPRYFDFVDKFPMNAAGKILKYKMREDAVERLGIKKTEGIVAQ